MAEPPDDLVSVTEVQFVAFNLACPHCGAAVALLGRIELTGDLRAAEPFCTCAACGSAAYLALRPA